MIEIVFVGFLLGIRHTMESDHVAAVASLVTKSPSMRQSILLGSVWGLGHTITLFIFGSAVLLLDQVIPENMALVLEFMVGLMLVILGVDVVWRFRREFVYHNSHLDESKQVERNHSNSSDKHRHGESFPIRALLVGIMHGMAGSAALMLLTLNSVHSFGIGLLYIALFGMGSIAGMAVLSMLIMFPLLHCSSYFIGLRQYLQLAIGSATTILGVSIMFSIANTG
ncbi:MAG: urease accessory protein [Mariprofundaceae bacterium]|nr:urease accessory protein [Mariprofundaceae bacterium]